MAFKTFSRACVLGLLAARVGAQEILANIDIYSTSTCGGDPNDLDLLSMTMSYQAAEEGANHSVCEQTEITLPEWPTTDEGKYSIWVDTSALKDDCQLRFIEILPGQEGSCLKFPAYRLLYPDHSLCADLEIARTFESFYCCGDDCGDPLKAREEALPEPREFASPAHVDRASDVKDVTRMKRSSPLAPKGKIQKRDCEYVREDATETWGPQAKIGPEIPCPIDCTGAGQDFTYSVGYEISDGWNINAEVGVELFEIVSASLSGGYEHVETEQSSFQTTEHLSVEDGTTMYPSFTPKIVCGKGSFQGDCSTLEGFEFLTGELPDQPLCVPKMIKQGDTPNIPDGRFTMVQVD